MHNNQVLTTKRRLRQYAATVFENALTINILYIILWYLYIKYCLHVIYIHITYLLFPCDV